MSENYRYRVWTGPDQIDAYITDVSHEPPQWQESDLTGQRKADAISIVTQDKIEAGNDGFYQVAINEEQRLYSRTSKDSGNSWEVKFDESWQEVPWPSVDPVPPPLFEKDLGDVKIVVRTVGSRVVILITGNVQK